jgi:PAS domain S-box-containing protein
MHTQQGIFLERGCIRFKKTLTFMDYSYYPDLLSRNANSFLNETFTLTHKEASIRRVSKEQVMDTPDVLNVAIVGGGRGCKAIMEMIFAEELRELRMKLIGVACPNPRAVGYVYAQENGIYTTRDYRDLYKLKDLNMIIELTGRDDVAKEIYRTRPDHVRLIDNVAARLFWVMFKIEEQRVAERQRSEEAASRARAELDQILENSPDGIRVLDKDFNVLRVNESFLALSGISRDATMDRKCYEGLPGPQCHTPGCPLTRILAGEERVEYDVEKTRIDGAKVFCIVTAAPFRSPSGELIGIVENFKDITDRKCLEAQLQQAHKMEAVGTLAGGMAHELNNLLMRIQGNVSLMLLDIDTTPHFERLKNIEKEVQSGARLTSHLLGYARKGKYEVKLLDLNQLVRETSDAFGRTRKQIRIHLELAKDLFIIEAGPGQTEQVLWDLLVNAADAMPGGGDLILRTMNTTHYYMKDKLYDPNPGNYVLLTVTDTGLGMDAQTAERIFDPFFTTKEMGRGTGLGLASAYGIIRSHGGHIDVESKKGHGTKFSIYLPASEKPLEKGIETAAVEVMKANGTVLLVEDDEVILEVGRDLLEAMGYQVLTAKDGKEAIEIYRKNQDDTDIVVLDMVMPNMGGGEAYDRLREICNGFIQKPFRMNELAEKIREIFEQEQA